MARGVEIRSDSCSCYTLTMHVTVLASEKSRCTLDIQNLVMSMLVPTILQGCLTISLASFLLYEAILRVRRGTAYCSERMR